ncbi:arabinofuranosidase [Achaetomium macrosporum]|uniref:Arabinofuranosidase n=1 Tax=Achaetomium macrosporum TaxID=79813 RepID=A0AAN7C470_9PEZI|nr:arabinofuranosidase [Achaetomium macrosporum]
MRIASIIGALTGLLGLGSAASFSNPLKATNGSDPFMVYSDGYYYLMTTTWTNLQITRAKTLEGLKNGETKVVWTDTNSARCCNVWGPSFIRLTTRAWYIYYTAGNGNNLDGQRPHVLKPTNDWGIDGTVLRVANKNYFVWSCFPEANMQSLCIAPMNSPTSIGTRSVLSRPTNSWEQVGSPPSVNEGAAPLYHYGRVFLAYGASFCWTSSYQVGLLTYNGGDPTKSSSWTKTGPFFSSANRNYGPGHNAFFNSPDGKEVWNVYHATWIQPGACDGNRYTAAQKVNWRSDGTADFGQPQPTGTVLVGPSGE